MQLTNVVIAAFITSALAANPKVVKKSVFDVAPKRAVLSFGTSPGCGAYCPTCGDETCVCGSVSGGGGQTGKPPCCNGYGSAGKALAGCVSIFPLIHFNSEIPALRI